MPVRTLYSARRKEEDVTLQDQSTQYVDVDQAMAAHKEQQTFG